jgi:Orsellinic acid/F9775 biosynthesis cluster protein D
LSEELDVITRSTIRDEPASASSPFPLALDATCNIAICTDCCIGIPFDWIKGHMKDNHGLKCNEEQVFECLDIMTRTMNSDEAREWLHDNRMIKKSIEGIPIREGVGCSLCPYSAKKRKAIYNHMSTSHRDENPKAIIVDRKVQKVFRGSLKQYIHVNVGDESEIMDEVIEGWKLHLNEDFARLVESHDRIEGSGSLDLKLINAFVAKIR